MLPYVPTQNIMERYANDNNRDLLIKGAKVWIFDHFEDLDVEVSRGRIIKACPDVTPQGGVRVIDARGLHLLPGLVDMHVHLREPGFSYKETIAGATEAAARGGFTTVCSMPNLTPAPDSGENLQRQLDIIDRDAVIQVLPYMTITKGRKGREPIDKEEAIGRRIAGFSDDGSGVQDPEVMRQAMSELCNLGLFAAHCEVNELLRGGYIHDGEYCRANGHKGICSESEWGEVKRDIELAAQTRCRLHICHISTAESVELVRQAKKRGVWVTCETAPHYLAFCDGDMRDEGRFKMNPPLRSAADREALRRGLADGTIDVVATDHAPHTDDEKSRGLAKSAMGVVGLETSFGAVYTYMVKTGLMTLERMVDAMTTRPRLLLGLEPGLRPGDLADLVLVDLDEKWTVNAAGFAGNAHSTPFDGVELQGRPVMTLYRGRTVYDRLTSDTDDHQL